MTQGGPATGTAAAHGVGEGFTRTASDYDAILTRNAAGARRLIDAVPEGDHRTVLDVGCGTGFASLAAIARFAPRRIVGVDPSTGMLEVFRDKLAAHPGVEVALHAAEVMTMPVPAGSADLVVSAMAFHWFPDKPGALREMARRLRPGGVLAILSSGAGSDRELEELMRSMEPPVPAAWVDVFAHLGWEAGTMEDAMEGAGLEPVDVWTERRRRRIAPADYLERLRVVGAHLSSGLTDEEAAAHGMRLLEALERAAGRGGFTYTFDKLFAIARRPDTAPAG